MGIAEHPALIMRKFRPAGAPAGSWPHTVWSHCVFHDPYERVNVWSHGVPAILFFLLAAWSGSNDSLEHNKALAVFGVCAGITHAFSAITHVYPDDHLLEKLDHIGIVALIAGTPFTAVMAAMPDASLTTMGLVTVALLGAAFLPPVPRTLSFVGLGSIMVLTYYAMLTPVFVLEVCLYCLGAFFFIRGEGHSRWTGFSDHHLLHYFVTVACCLHVYFIVQGGRV